MLESEYDYFCYDGLTPTGIDCTALIDISTLYPEHTEQINDEWKKQKFVIVGIRGSAGAEINDIDQVDEQDSNASNAIIERCQHPESGINYDIVNGKISLHMNFFVIVSKDNLDVGDELYVSYGKNFWLEPSEFSKDDFLKEFQSIKKKCSKNKEKHNKGEESYKQSYKHKKHKGEKIIEVYTPDEKSPVFFEHESEADENIPLQKAIIESVITPKYKTIQEHATELSEYIKTDMYGVPKEHIPFTEKVTRLSVPKYAWPLSFNPTRKGSFRVQFVIHEQTEREVWGEDADDYESYPKIHIKSTTRTNTYTVNPANINRNSSVITDEDRMHLDATNALVYLGKKQNVMSNLSKRIRAIKL